MYTGTSILGSGKYDVYAVTFSQHTLRYAESGSRADKACPGRKFHRHHQRYYPTHVSSEVSMMLDDGIQEMNEAEQLQIQEWQQEATV